MKRAQALLMTVLLLVGTIAGCSSSSQLKASKSSSLSDRSRAATLDNQDRFLDDDEADQEDRFDDEADGFIEENDSEESGSHRIQQRKPLLETNASRLCGDLIYERKRLAEASKLGSACIRGLLTDGADMIGRGWEQRNYCRKHVEDEKRRWQRTPGNAGAKWPHAKSTKAWCRKAVKRYKKELKAQTRELKRVDDELLDAGQDEQICVAEAKRRAGMRAAAATSLSIPQIESIPAEYRVAVESARLVSLREKKQKEEIDKAQQIREREAAAAAQLASLREEERTLEAERIREQRAQEALLIEQHRGDSKWMRPVLSAHVCANQGNKRATLKEIKTEKRYTKVGGITNMEKLYGLQQDIRHFDEKITEAKTRLKKFGTKPLPCKSKKVRLLTQCIWSTVVTYTSPEMAARVSVGFGGNIQAGNKAHRGPVCDDKTISEFVPLL